MAANAMLVNIVAADASIRDLASGAWGEAFQHHGLKLTESEQPASTLLVLDSPPLWAFSVLEKLTGADLFRTVVATQSTHIIYGDCLRSLGPSGVFVFSDFRAGLAALLVAANGPNKPQFESDLTGAELEVMRRLLQGKSTTTIARDLGVARSTINTHCSSILQKTRCTDRTQLVSRILGHYSDQDSNSYLPR